MKLHTVLHGMKLLALLHSCFITNLRLRLLTLCRRIVLYVMKLIRLLHSFSITNLQLRVQSASKSSYTFIRELWVCSSSLSKLSLVVSRSATTICSISSWVAKRGAYIVIRINKIIELFLKYDLKLAIHSLYTYSLTGPFWLMEKVALRKICVSWTVLMTPLLLCT